MCNIRLMTLGCCLLTLSLCVTSGEVLSREGCTIQNVPNEIKFQEGWIVKFSKEARDYYIESGTTSVVVNITGGVPPYTWSVIDGDFSLSGTAGTENTVSADNGGCSTEIEVRDKLNTVINAYVYNKNVGYWLKVYGFEDSRACQIPGAGTLYGSGDSQWYYERYSGIGRQRQLTEKVRQPSDTCDNGAYCDSTVGCDNCIDPSHEMGDGMFCVHWMDYYEWTCD